MSTISEKIGKKAGTAASFLDGARSRLYTDHKTDTASESATHRQCSKENYSSDFANDDGSNDLEKSANSTAKPEETKDTIGEEEEPSENTNLRAELTGRSRRKSLETEKQIRKAFKESFRSGLAMTSMSQG